MPSATDELRSTMDKWFGHSTCDSGPYAFLRARGWRDHAGMLIKPTSAYTPSSYEWTCVNFLCDEWDFGYDPAVSPQDLRHE